MPCTGTVSGARAGMLALGCSLGTGYASGMPAALGHGERGDGAVHPGSGAGLGVAVGIQPGFKLMPGLLHVDKARHTGQQPAPLMHATRRRVMSPVAACVPGDRYRPMPGAWDAMGILHVSRKWVPR